MLKYSSYQSIYEQPSFRRPVERRLHMNTFLKSRLSKIAVLLIILSITCTGMVQAFAASNDNTAAEEQKYVVVMPGDTLWEIAVAHKPQGQDTRVYIQKLMRTNGLGTSSIQAGDTLMLPAKH
ncbi:MAG: LysM peptidoglycan-binding domain-containing protein [Paenibacillaceae bacterium]|uniref:LysM peptidoglycan-binding domain-containing protein n=1 Tax=Paenibacillus mellifer TaxID=2937794 RepID=A0A9X1XWF6_9BACL|nr:LysM peptidoglycan-binding domain-containing protein [Paenibacillus mellifer]MBW4841013.1 LysM peptidoglycan-binding domain-containing protein [Paenibacillaceae bacterium]MCK8486840.1 LysM peptidoglycan-binding domain-containing protein [Paenibacillus mellifer]